MPTRSFTCRRRGNCCSIERFRTEGSQRYTAVELIPLQLLAYHVAVYLGKDVDQPRDFSKTVMSD